jgi:hypothetical protein
MPNIDLLVTNWLIAELRKDTGIDVSNDEVVMQRLKAAAERARIDLSSKTETEINLPFLTADANGPKHLQKHLTHTRLEEMCALAKESPQQTQWSAAFLVGSWRIRIEDAFGSEMYFVFLPDGACQGSQYVPAMGQMQLQGGWLFEPTQQVLMVEGVIALVPTCLAIKLMPPGPQGELRGVDNNGIGYVFERA